MKFLRKLLFPFSIIYGVVTAVRNKLYDIGWLKSKSYNLPVICVGNLSTGGTGKSPMVEFLVDLLKENHNLAVLSRGYKRKTKGFREVLSNSTAEEVGDEPLQFKKKFPEVTVAVCEDRQTGIEQLQNSSELIVLDDAFQHRKVNPSLSILLTDFSHLYSDDLVLPAGDLREPRSGAKRADILVVTKCPETLSKSAMQSIKKRLKPGSDQHLYFTKIVYGEEIKNYEESKPLSFLKDKKFTLVTGIAKPQPLVEYLEMNFSGFTHRSFDDHHHFSPSELKEFEKEEIILTTEKDFMRLQPFINDAKIFYLPITITFLDNGMDEFHKRVQRSSLI